MTNEELQRYLFKLYVFADKRGIGNLANDTITMLAAYWSENLVALSEVAWVILLVSRNSKLYALILDTLVLELRQEDLDDRRLNATDLPKELLFDLLIRSNKLAERFSETCQCFESVCYYHCHEGEGIMSGEDCITKIEAGHNLYNELDNLEQFTWEYDA